MQMVAAEPEVTIRRALILSLADFDDDALPERSVLIEWLSNIFEQERDAGLHAAAAYMLTTLGEDSRGVTVLLDPRQTEQQALPVHQRGADESPSWSVNGQGQTMIAIPGPVEFLIGSSPGEDGREANESQHTVRIGRSFAIAAETVSVAEYRRLCATDRDSATAYLSPENPVTYVSWFDAAEYCNRLSEQERIPQDQWCYEISADRNVATVRPNALGLVGYRLPTEAEMEYAARAGAATSRFFGESDELLVRYGWYVPNSQGRLQRSGRLRPNDFGLFDTLGNVWNWCHDEHRDYSHVGTDQVFNDESLDSLSDSVPRTLRGACYTDHSPALRVAHRWAREPDYAGNLIGFRIARTVNPL
jgi:formylglycine-generating enzyme required for sulfatase activity